MFFGGLGRELEEFFRSSTDLQLEECSNCHTWAIMDRSYTVENGKTIPIYKCPVCGYIKRTEGF